MGFVSWAPAPVDGYSVSSEGDVRRDAGGRGTWAGRILDGWTSGNGYQYVELYQDGERSTWPVHRLVCWAWHGPPPTDSHDVDHLDGDIRHNHPGNLEWVTRSENMLRHYARKNGDLRFPWEEEEIEPEATE